MKVYQQIASSLVAMVNCEKSGNDEWFMKHRETIKTICDNHLPSGSGIDCGTKLDFDASKPNRLVFNTSYHHMTEGSYDGWTEHQVIVTPDLAFGLDLRITGRDRNQIKEYLGELYNSALNEEIVAR